MNASKDAFTEACQTHLDLQVPLRPGAHASADRISTEYDPATVATQFSFLQKSESWSRERMSAWVQERLRKLLHHAQETVPYYTRIFWEVGFDPSTARLPEDLQEIPLLTKEEIREARYDLVSRSYSPLDLTYMTTGGSTGDPLRIIMDREFRSRNHANTHYYLGLAGYELGKARSIRLHGDVLGEEPDGSQVKWVEEGNRLTMSVFALNKTTVPEYVDAIDRFSPAYIHGYPSALMILAQTMQQLGLRFARPFESIFTDSESTLPHQRDLIELVMGGHVFDTYGHTEGAVLGVTFPGSRKLALLPQVGFTEFIPPPGCPTGFPGREVVVTGFNNWAFPLIRYRTGDVAVLSPDSGEVPPSYVGLEQVEGRLQDYVVDSRGDWVAISPALFDYNFDWSGVERFQVQQSVAGQLTFAFVKEKNGIFSSADIVRRIEEGFSRILGGTFKIHADEKAQLALTDRGKYRYVNQQLRMSDPIG